MRWLAQGHALSPRSWDLSHLSLFKEIRSRQNKALVFRWPHVLIQFHSQEINPLKVRSRSQADTIRGTRMIKILPCPQGPPSLRGGDGIRQSREGSRPQGGVREKDFLEVGASEQGLEGWLSLWPEEMGGKVSETKGRAEAKEGRKSTHS